jgi:hypothetical protein
MCLTIQKVNGKTIQTAEQDIVCYKRVVVHKKRWTPVYGPLPREYEYNKVLPAEKFYWSPWSKPDILHPIAPAGYKEIEHLQVEYASSPYKESEGGIINEGFHANLIRKNVPYTGAYYDQRKICIIPKGTEICYGTNDDIVAVNMIVFRNLFRYCIYKFHDLIKR